MGKTAHRNAKHFSVYLIENTDNPNVYIGITSRTVERRFLDHIYLSNKGSSHCVHLYAAMRKYGTDKFKARLIDVSDTWQGACEKERYYIKKFNSYGNGYNASPGGDGLPGFKWAFEKCVRTWKEVGDTKICNKCGMKKDIFEFSFRDHIHKYGRRKRPLAECKSCVSKRSGEYAKANRDKVNAWKRKRRHETGFSKRYSKQYQHEGVSV